VKKVYGEKGRRGGGRGNGGKVGDEPSTEAWPEELNKWEGRSLYRKRLVIRVRG